MATSPNAPEYQDMVRDRPRSRVTAMVIVAIVLGVAALLAVTTLMYRGAPTLETPGKIDNAEGVQPQYPPATPVEPSPAER